MSTRARYREAERRFLQDLRDQGVDEETAWRAWILNYALSQLLDRGYAPEEIGQAAMAVAVDRKRQEMERAAGQQCAAAADDDDLPEVR